MFSNEGPKKLRDIHKDFYKKSHILSRGNADENMKNKLRKSKRKRKESAFHESDLESGTEEEEDDENDENETPDLFIGPNYSITKTTLKTPKKPKKPLIQLSISAAAERMQHIFNLTSSLAA